MKKLLAIALVAISLVACKKTEVKDSYLTPTPPQTYTVEGRWLWGIVKNEDFVTNVVINDAPWPGDDIVFGSQGYFTFNHMGIIRTEPYEYTPGLLTYNYSPYDVLQLDAHNLIIKKVVYDNGRPISAQTMNFNR